MVGMVRRLRAWPILLLLLIAAGNAHAVVQNISVVNSAGQPVANATVFIVFPDGTTEKEGKTDEKGILWFNFPNDGNYSIRYPGGVMKYTVTGTTAATAGTSWVSWTLAGLGVVAAGAGLSNAGDDDDDDESSVSPGSPGSGGGTIAGTYNCTGSQVTNQDGHPIGSLNGSYSVTTSGSNVTIAHSAGNTSFSIQGTSSGNNITASGTGTFEGRTNSQVSFSGTAPPLQGNLTVTCPACPDTDGDSTPDPVQLNESCTGP